MNSHSNATYFNDRNGNVENNDTPTSTDLETLTRKWLGASEEKRRVALLVLLGHDTPDIFSDDRFVVRWKEAAEKLSVTTRCLRMAVKHAGITPVRLPGRNRSIGLRLADLRTLVEGGLS